MLTMLIAVAMNAMFGEANAATYMAWGYTGFAVSPLIWPQLMTLFINPHRLAPSVPFMEDGSIVLYFAPEVFNRVNGFLFFQLAVHLILCVGLTLFLKPPTELQGTLGEWLESLLACRGRKAMGILRESRHLVRSKFGKSIAKNLARLPKKFSANLRAQFGWKTQKEALKEEVRRVEFERHLLSKSVFQLEKNKPLPGHQSCCQMGQFAVELESSEVIKTIGSRQSFEEVKAPGQKDFLIQTLRSREFQLIFFVTFLRIWSNRYFNASFKLIGLFYFQSDALMNFIGSLCYFFYIAEGLSFGPLLKRLGLSNCYKLHFASTFVVHVLYLCHPNSLMLFALLSGVSRFGQGFNTMLNMSTIFGKYGKEDGLSIYKFYDIASLLGGFFAVKAIAYYGTHYASMIAFFAGVNFLGFSMIPFLNLEKPPKEKSGSQELLLRSENNS